MYIYVKNRNKPAQNGNGGSNHTYRLEKKSPGIPFYSRTKLFEIRTKFPHIRSKPSNSLLITRLKSIDGPGVSAPVVSCGSAAKRRTLA